MTSYTESNWSEFEAKIAERDAVIRTAEVGVEYACGCYVYETVTGTAKDVATRRMELQASKHHYCRRHSAASR